MGVFLSVVVSTFEGLAIFLLMFALFRHKSCLTQNLRICYFSFLLSVLSYFLRQKLNLAGIDPLVHLILIYVFIRVVYRMKWLSIALVELSGFLLYAMIQLAIILLVQKLNIVSYEDSLSSISTGAIVIQVLSIAASLAVVALLRWKHIGFTFISFHRSIRLKARSTKMLSIFLLATVVSMLASFFLYFINVKLMVYFISPIMVVSFIALLQESYQMEQIELNE